jgi:nucleotide-binding universal stress UspA family protein
MGMGGAGKGRFYRGVGPARRVDVPARFGQAWAARSSPQDWREERKEEAAMFKKILLAYNGSHEGRSALLACAEIASFAKSETHLLAVAGMPSSMFLTEGFLPEELLEEEKKRAQDILNEGIQQLKQKGFSVAGHLAVGEPVEEICRLAVELKCDLIVVGHRQKASFASRWWRGSVGKSLLDHAPCSIFVALTGD